MQIIDRLFLFFRENNLSNYKVEQDCGLSNGYLRNLKKSPSVEILEKILATYPNLNREWVMTGSGSMTTSVPVIKENKTEERLREDIRSIRKNLKITQKEMGENLGIGESSYSRIENGDIAISYAHLMCISKAFGMSIQNILSYGQESGNSIEHDTHTEQVRNENEIIVLLQLTIEKMQKTIDNQEREIDDLRERINELKGATVAPRRSVATA